MGVRTQSAQEYLNRKKTGNYFHSDDVLRHQHSSPNIIRVDHTKDDEFGGASDRHGRNTEIHTKFGGKS